ncbi:MAG: serine hydrolase [Bacteriovoracaceae bacterium]
MHIPYYDSFLTPAMKSKLLSKAKPVDGIVGLTHIGVSGGLETNESLQFLIELFLDVRLELNEVLKQRKVDRTFIDERVKATYVFNKDLRIDPLSPEYKTVIGLEDDHGRIVMGPKNSFYNKAGYGEKVGPIPEFLQGPHVTLFGPPDSAKLCINAMNAYHRRLKNEPAIVEELLALSHNLPKWGADDEDSKTPLRDDLISSGVNLSASFEGKIQLSENGKSYDLAKDHLSLPIKRIPGLALPSMFLFFENEPIPLHLYDFALHFFHHCHNAKALAFYIPKLENEEEARYIKKMLSSAEALILKHKNDYLAGSIKLMIVLENPRAILRTNEIMDELFPYFAGASLGWHDYLASTARLFKEDGNYRIPVKADPNIVINYIKASHDLLAEVVGSRGGVKIGGMYGVLSIDSDPNSASFQLTLKGYFKDVLTQLKRNLNGFWVAHPDFIRIGLALVTAWDIYKKGDQSKLEKLVRGVLNEKYHEEILAWAKAPDLQGLDKDSPLYARSLMVADLKESTFIANNHPEEVRYNVFQTLQYLTDWLTGNGCVALPALIDGIPVRVMDDLATAERSRWEVWHEIYHGRFCVEDFIRIAHEEMHFIRKDLSNEKKIVQVKWDERTEKWYSIAMKLMFKLMTDKIPCEFATELLLPFTFSQVREAKDPWSEILKLDAKHFELDQKTERFHQYFEVCGSRKFAKKLCHMAVLDLELVEKEIMSFELEDIKEAASFHGDIGEGKKTLDAMASSEQAGVFNESDSLKGELASLGSEYLKKFGLKFLISAKGKSGKELLSSLKTRLNNTLEVELLNAKLALWEITAKRLNNHSTDNLKNHFQALMTKHNVTGTQIAILTGDDTNQIQTLCFGEAEMGKRKVIDSTLFEMASLSKTVATAFALEYFKSKNIPLSTPVNEVFSHTKSSFRLKSLKNAYPEWSEEVTIKHLMSHEALNMHYVHGVPTDKQMPDVSEFLNGNTEFGYEPIGVLNKPGTMFQYSGGGFLVLEHLISSLEEKSITELSKTFLKNLGLENFSFSGETISGKDYAFGYTVKGEVVPSGRLMFPAFAAGSVGSAHDCAHFLQHLARAYNSVEGSGGISHDTAMEMLHGSDKGCMKFMGCKMGIGVFIAEAGENRFMVHQGANDGFRCLYLHCFKGPNAGIGLVAFCNAELNGVLFISEVTQAFLTHFKMHGVNTSHFKSDFVATNIPQQELVNMGYRNLVFNSFEATLPEPIIEKGTKDHLAPYNLVIGAKILEVSNQRFARAENLISDHLPLFDPKLFGKQGKVMDSWETVRHNPNEYDFLIFELAKPATINYVSFSTKYHFGNQAEFISLLGWNEGTWDVIVPKSAMLGHALKKVKVNGKRYQKFKILMYPDGGFTRLSLFETLPADEISYFLPHDQAQALPYVEKIPVPKKPLNISYLPTKAEIEANFARYKKGDEVNVASLALGAKLLNATNEHYGPAVQVLSPFAPINMFDGLESARSRKKGHHEEIIVELAKASKLYRLEMDFTYFVNNNPLFVKVEGKSGDKWTEIVPKTKVKAFAGNTKTFEILSNDHFEQLKVVTYPDGGMNRFRAMTIL